MSITLVGGVGFQRFPTPETWNPRMRMHSYFLNDVPAPSIARQYTRQPLEKGAGKLPPYGRQALGGTSMTMPARKKAAAGISLVKSRSMSANAVSSCSGA